MIDREEKELIKKAKKNIKEFDKLYQRYFPQINNFVYHRVGTREEREEIVSNTFYKAMKKLNLFRFIESRKCSFSGWLYRIAINEVNRFYRDYHKDNKIVKAQKKEKPIKMQDTMGYSIEYHQVKQAMKKLSPDEQNLITLKYFEKLSYKEIADIYKNKKVNALKVKTHRALKKIKADLKEEKNYAELR